jgi:hypothetical protein
MMPPVSYCLLILALFLALLLCTGLGWTAARVVPLVEAVRAGDLGKTQTAINLASRLTRNRATGHAGRFGRKSKAGATESLRM